MSVVVSFQWTWSLISKAVLSLANSSSRIPANPCSICQLSTLTGAPATYLWAPTLTDEPGLSLLVISACRGPVLRVGTTNQLSRDSRCFQPGFPKPLVVCKVTKRSDDTQGQACTAMRWFIKENQQSTTLPFSYLAMTCPEMFYRKRKTPRKKNTF